METVTFAGVRLLGLPGRVMMPRPASEQLVDATRTHVGDRAARVADVGTGSGAVAIAIALACPDAVVWATDVSASAVRLARANVRVHELAGRVHVCQGDLLASVPGRFDVIAANLPYLPASAASDYPELADEPFDAVFAAGDGLASYRRLVAAAGSRLADNGLVILQLDRRLVAARVEELPALEAALGQDATNASERAMVLEAIARAAA